MEYVAFSFEGKVVLTQMNISGKFNFGWAALKRVCIARRRPKLLAVGGRGGGLLACIGKWCELEHPLTAFTRPVREGWRWLFFAKKKCLKWTI